MIRMEFLNNKKSVEPYVGRIYTNPWTTQFLYTKNQNYNLIGYPNDMKKWKENNLSGQPYIERYDYWKDGKSRGAWQFCNTSIHIKRPSPYPDDSRSLPSFKRHFSFFVSINGHYQLVLKLRQIPKKWIPEYDQIIQQIKG